jgi:NodT family efflux transporter outer membrane factor (OMF) lipoprotein
MLLVLPSCAIAPLRPADPAPGLPPTFQGRASPDNSAQLGIAEFFNDPQLVALIDQAMAGNRELKILNEEVAVAGNEILARSGRYLPFVTFGAGAGVEKRSDFTPEGAAEKDLEYAPGKHFPDPVPDFKLGLRLFWEPDIWREFRNARDAAAQRYFAAKERRNYFVTRLVAEVAESYYRLMALDVRLETLDQTIKLFERSLETAKSRKEAGRDTALPIQRFQAEVRKYQSEKLIVRQEIIEVENRINFLANRFPQPVERASGGFFDLTIHALRVGVPAQLLQNRPDVRQAEHELEAAGLDVKVARAHFFPRLEITAGVGYEAFSPKYLFNTPGALAYNAAGDLVAPLINRRAIQAEYATANARQLQSVYDYQRVVLNAFTEVVNRVSRVENYRRSIEIKKQQLDSLQAAVEFANKLFLAARGEYLEVLLAQRDRLEATTVLIETKSQQLSAIVNAYQALGGGDLLGHDKAACSGPGAPTPHAATPPAPEMLPAPKPAEKKDQVPELLPPPRSDEKNDKTSAAAPAEPQEPASAGGEGIYEALPPIR